MNPPVDPVQQFFSMWAQANTAVWPMEVVWYVAAVAAIGLATRPIRHSSRLIAAFLAVYYVWLGVVFFAVYYSALDDGAMKDGAMFVLGGLLFLLAGVTRQDLRFQARWDLPGVVGGILIAYALAVYPVIGILFGGHVFPAAPLFGLAPCPSTIFTAGLLLWTRPRLPMYVLVVPLIWLMAMTPAAAIEMSVVGDVARPVAGVLATVLLVWRDYSGVRQRLFGAGLVMLAILSLAHIELLMGVGGLYLLAMLAGWLRHRTGGPLHALAAHRLHHAGGSS